MGATIDENLLNFCQKVPKIELHAHLNGSLSSETLKTLRLMHPDKLSQPEQLLKYETLDDVFEVFSLAHSLTTTAETVYTAAYSTIKEFYEDNVIYLELRSTPRCEENMSKKDYISAILRAIRVCQAEKMDIIVKLLISINRKQCLKAAKENVALAIEMSKDNPDIVGIDLSGDPTKGSAFLDLLEQARTAGLKIAAHCAEVSNEEEASDIIRFKPDRLGHCTCIHKNTNGSDALFQLLLDSKIPVELCLTSNVRSKTILNYKSHHFQYFYAANHPICICTDDKGIFETILSKELALVCQYFSLTKKDLITIMKSTVNYIFDSDLSKKKLLNIIEKFEY